jgi:replication factor A1
MSKFPFHRLTSSTDSSRIVILLGLEVLSEYGEPERIGTPITIDTVPIEPQPSEVNSAGFYGNNRPQQPVAPRPAAGRNQVISDSSHANLYPIEALSPYAHRWTIRARVTHKSPIKTWHNANGEGRLFSINLLDESGEIRGTAFHSVGDVFDQWYEMLQKDSVYYISNPCSVRMAKKQFSQINNDYELMFEKDTRIEMAQDQGSVPQVRYNFTNIGDLQSVEKDTTIDAIGVLKEIGEVAQIVSKTTSKPFDKRDLTIVDNTLHSVRLTIWGETATTFDAPLESIVAFKGVKVSDFGGRSLSLLASGSMTVGPDIDEAHKLKGWYDAQGRDDQYTSHANTISTGSGRNDVTKTIVEVKDESLGMSESPDYFSLKATILFIKQDNMYYPACKSERCNKKVVEIEIGQWRCESCDKTWDSPRHRYVVSMNAADHSGQIWLSMFDESAALVIGRSADDIQQLKEEGEDNAVNSIIQDATCKTFIFRCRAKLDTFKDESK